jgi:diaminopimelate epimerase
MNIPFTKMHGLGNDFVIIDNRNNLIKKLKPLSLKLCDRRLGVGADQLLVLGGSKKADFRMRIFNADGSEVEMCGNGVRCLAKYIWDRKLKRSSPLEIETSAGIIRPERKGALIRVDMGEPVFEPGKIPLNLTALYSKHTSQNLSTVIDYPLSVDGKTFKITCLSMGNPHAVIVCSNIQSVDLLSVGPAIEHHRLFPNRTNVEFVQVVACKKILVRVWERGSGETLACGTGASASAVAASLLGLTSRAVTVSLRGGNLSIRWFKENNHVYMTGPATPVFEGTIAV